MKLLYFAWLRAKIGTAAEEVTPPGDVADVGGLIDWLKTRGPGYAEALANPEVVRVAVNHEYVGRDHPVAPGDEVALFPPVTGG
jgi:molybdopterin synthase sulfur carrier subunit